MGSELSSTGQKTISIRESTYGTDAVNAALEANSALRWDANTEVSMSMQGDFRERNIMRAGFGHSQGQYIRHNLGVSVSGLVNVPGTVGNGPLDMADYMVAAGAVETLGATAAYTPSTTAQAGLSIYHFQRHIDEYKHRLIRAIGVRGDFVIRGSIREFLTWQFTGQSKNFDVDSSLTSNPHGWSLDLSFFAADGTILLANDGDTPGGTWDGAAAETTNDELGLFLEPDAVVTIDGVAFPVSDFEFGFGNVVSVRDRTSATTEADAVYIVQRKPYLNVTLDETGAAFEKAIDILHANSEVAATLVTTDGTGSGGITLTLSVPKLQLRSVDGPSDREGLSTWAIPCQCNDNHDDGLGDDAWSLTWSTTA